MKKYKLIKKYPGVKLEVGDIVEYIIPPSGTIYQYYCVKKSEGISGVLPQDYPEFWKEVIEEEYKILSFTNPNGTPMMVGETDQGWFTGVQETGSNNYRNVKWLLIREYKILSIKRLSDGEVFTIGDTVTDVMSDNKNVTISRLSIHLNKLCIEVVKGSLTTNVTLSFLDKVKQPLCKSEDGVDIYEDDLVVCFDKEDWITRNEKYSFQPRDVKDPNYLFFSTLEAANEYILMNKPCLSLQDVMTAGYGMGEYARLEAVVKSKIPQS